MANARTGAQFARGLNGAVLVILAIVVLGGMPAIRTRWAGMPDQSWE